MASRKTHRNKHRRAHSRRQRKHRGGYAASPEAQLQKAAQVASLLSGAQKGGADMMPPPPGMASMPSMRSMKGGRNQMMGMRTATAMPTAVPMARVPMPAGAVARAPMRGGMAPVGDASMLLGQKDNLAQGSQFLDIHKAQHGGMAPYPGGVSDSVLSGPMVESARTGPLDVAMGQIKGMQDGGRRRGRKHRGKKGTRRHRKHRGGGHGGHGGHYLGGSPVNADAMLLPAGLEKQAALNYDWSAARDPNYWAPKP